MSFSRDDYASYRIQRAKETLDEVDVLIANGFWNTAANRMYYASFYAVNAVLSKNGINVSSHAGVRRMFGQHFVRTGLVERSLARHYTDLFEKRNKGDYDDFFDFDEESVIRLVPLTRQLVHELENLLNSKV